MKVKSEALYEYLEKNGLTTTEFAQESEIAAADMELLLKGEAVAEPVARKFIFFVGADEAQRLIDWEAIGKINPLADEVAGGDEE